MKALAQWLSVVVATLKGYRKNEVLFLLAQSAHETGNWGSKSLWWQDRNLFGMSEMQNEQRRRRLRGVRLGPDGLMRAQFKTLLGSVLDRLDWDAQMEIGRGEYYAKNASKKYHPSPAYYPQVDSRISSDLERAYWFSLSTLPLLIILITKWLSKTF